MSLTPFTALRLPISLIAITLILAACTPPSPRQFLVSISEAEGGSVTVNGVNRAVPWSSSFYEGTVVTLQAVANSGYEFRSWSGDHAGSENPLSLTVNRALSLGLSFSHLPALVAAPSFGEFGTVQVGDSREVAFTLANHGGGVLTGVIETSAPFSVVSGATLHLSEGESQQVVVRYSPVAEGSSTGNLAINGNVSRNIGLSGSGTLALGALWDLGVSVSGSGTVYSDPAGVVCPGSCSASFVDGTEVTLLVGPGSAVATPRWSGCQAPIGSAAAAESCSLTMGSNRTVLVDFSQDPFLVVTPSSADFGAVQLGEARDVVFTVANHGGGTLSGVAEATAPFSVVSGSTYSLASGSSQSVVVRYAPSVNGVSEGEVMFGGGSGRSITVTGFGSPTPVVSHPVQVTVSGNGRVVSEPAGIDCTGTCSAQFPAGTELVLTATPSQSTAESTWAGCDTPANGGVVSSTCTLSVTNARSVIVDFTTVETVSVSIVPGAATMFTSGTQTFTASVSGTADERVLWTTTAGILTGTGPTVMYRAPTYAGSFRLTATSLADPSASTSITVIVDPRLVVQVSGGTDFSLALRNDGTVWSWGNNDWGQLGTGGTIPATAPQQVYALYDIVKIASAGHQAAALRSDGTVWTWGAGHSALVPTRRTELADVTDIAVGDSHVLAVVSSGDVYSWGNNSSGQLGDGTIENRAHPGLVQTLSNIRSVGAGGAHSLAVDNDGIVYGWGNTNFYQVTSNVSEEELCSYSRMCLGVPKPIWHSPSVSLFGGADSTHALSNYGTVFGWGSNGMGQLGTVSQDECWIRGDLGSYECSQNPLQVSGLYQVAGLAAGRWHVVAFTTSGSAYAWGSAINGQIGAPTSDLCRPGAAPFFDCAQTPVRINSLSGVVAVGAGTDHSLAVTSNGTVWAWGDNSNGQLGDGTYVQRSAPVRVQMP